MNKTKKIIPVIDCPICGEKDAPLAYEATMTKKGKPNIIVWSCAHCGKVPNLGEDIEVKKYVSIKELEELGWKQEKESV